MAPGGGAGWLSLWRGHMYTGAHEKPNSYYIVLHFSTSNFCPSLASSAWNFGNPDRNHPPRLMPLNVASASASLISIGAFPLPAAAASAERLDHALVFTKVQS
jgi:hypothetical protein